jgi:hypothetical protein
MHRVSVILLLSLLAYVTAQTTSTAPLTTVQCVKCPCDTAPGYQPNGCPLCYECTSPPASTDPEDGQTQAPTTGARKICPVCECGEFGQSDENGCSWCVPSCSAKRPCPNCVCGFSTAVSNGCNVCNLCGASVRSSASKSAMISSCGLAAALAVFL